MNKEEPKDFHELEESLCVAVAENHEGDVGLGASVFHSRKWVQDVVVYLRSV